MAYVTPQCRHMHIADENMPDLVAAVEDKVAEHAEHAE
jgi:hypothetical protein